MADALGVALAFLNRRERTEAEVRSRLERAALPVSEIDAVLEELRAYGYVDDARYARLFTEDKRALEGWGSARIARSLADRGVAREVIESALTGATGSVGADAGADGAGADGSEDELARAVRVLSRRFAHPRSDRRERERAFGLLVRKGYDAELVAAAIRVWSENGSVIAPPGERYYDG
jgi:regulatory protein